MVAIFLSKTYAQAFADKCHEWLQTNCPNYSASIWQVPTANKDATKFFVEVPQEFEKDYYPVKEKITVATDREYKKASEVKPKPDASFEAAAVKP
jgi:hypothetical protein